MIRFTLRPRAPGRHSATKPTLSLLAVSLLGALVFASSAHAIAQPIGLGAADSFAVLGGTGLGGGVTNSGITTIQGDLGALPNPTYGDTGTTVFIAPYVNHAGDGVTFNAKAALGIAYDNADGQIVDFPIVAALGGTTLTPGVYNTPATISVNGPVTLDAQGNPNAIFVIQGT